jgi:6-pyruvoyl-tetrahydropterin synthase related domain
MKQQGVGNREQGVERRVPQVSLLRPGIFRRFFGPLIICFAALLATSPELIRNTSCGHDYDFHLASWLDAQAAWKHGLFYPHWAPSPNYGAGEPRFVFYPPLTWMLGAAFGLIFPWKGVELAITCSFLGLSGLATRLLARHAGMSDGAATLAGCAALFSGYSMFTAYERSAFGELAGGFWIPLLLFLVFRDCNPSGATIRRAFDGSAVLLALVIAGAWLSNAPLGVMASYLLAAVALAVALIRRSWAPILRATIAVIVGLGLSAIYLVPAALQQRWVQIRQATDDPGLAIENSFLFGHHADPNLELHDVELWRVSLLAVITIGLAFLCIFIAWRRGRLPRERAIWIPLALIPIVILLLQLPLSLPLWNLLPKLRFLQFPWRWLVVVEAPIGIFVAAAVWPTRRWLRVIVVAVSAAAFVFVTTFTLLVFHQHCDKEDSVAGMLSAYRSGQGFEGTDEYAPPRADNTLMAVGLPDACLTTNPDVVLAASEDGNTPEWNAANGHCDATFAWLRRNGRLAPEHRRLTADLPHAGFLILHLREYAAWQVHLNGNLLAFGADPAIPPLPHREDGLMVIPVGAGRVDLAVDWATTRDAVIGRWLSGLALILLTLLYFAERQSHPSDVPVTA